MGVSKMSECSFGLLRKQTLRTTVCTTVPWSRFKGKARRMTDESEFGGDIRNVWVGVFGLRLVAKLCAIFSIWLTHRARWQDVCRMAALTRCLFIQSHSSVSVRLDETRYIVVRVVLSLLRPPLTNISSQYGHAPGFIWFWIIEND